ncbi:MAG: helix-turn-helix domain-containing protein [Saprospiraceae bacterium]
MHTITEDVRENIKKMREFKGISPEQMATQLGMSPRAYHDFENGGTKIDLARLEKIAPILEVTLDQLMHLHERSIFNTLNYHQNGQCIVANNNVFVVDRDVY